MKTPIRMPINYNTDGETPLIYIHARPSAELHGMIVLCRVCDPDQCGDGCLTRLRIYTPQHMDISLIIPAPWFRESRAWANV